MKLGFIGCGNMGSAIMNGILNCRMVTPDEIMVSDKNEQAIMKAKQEKGVLGTADNCTAVGFADILFLAVKPQYYEDVLAEIKDALSDRQIIVSIAPGKTLGWIGERLGETRKIVRTMPNTPALVGEGMTGVCRNQNVTQQEMETVLNILKSFGKAEVVPENLMDVVVSVSGSSPAYVFMFIEAMADAAVADGMPRAQAYEFAAQSVLGSAKLMLETGKHPGELKDMVCSPGGTTIEAVRVLEKQGFRSSVIEAMKACVRKAKGL
ncbi:pyrroline-5-carboxylate reductase [Ruminococcus gauvreauii]|uniref:pyrroline-5-carboxylate reductase n=1 Tax=Ruminococcus gauvreauii TaxID=438033 RepID=UPI0039843842